jgi:antitoxin (DNA-binding transcriptional repressor) of toxin-antitoxin stability system
MVKAGETVEVTERGRLVALLVSPAPAVAARDRLVGTGRLVPARGRFRLPARRSLPAGEVTASEALDELREERLL